MSALLVGIAGGWVLVARARRRYNGPSEYVHGPKALADVEAFLFDLDGTLIDSNAAHADTWAQALREHGIACDAADVRPLVGVGGDKLLPQLAYGEVTCELTRYDVGGKVTDRDVEVAKKISSVYRQRS